MKEKLRIVRKKIRRAGFTLVEMMLVLGIIAVIMGSAIFMLGGGLGDAQIVMAQADIKMVETQLQGYKMLAGRYPTETQGLDSLISKPTVPPIPKRWRGNRFDNNRLPTDPWGNDYQYRMPAKQSGKDYDLFSFGPDGQEGGGDDVGNWE